MTTLGITAIVTAHQRIAELLVTLEKLRGCVPLPDEILVHVDAGNDACVSAVHEAFPDITVMASRGNVGPGGGRNQLIAAARHDIVASFDDDSYPIDGDYFGRVRQLFDAFPDAWIVNGSVCERGRSVTPDSTAHQWVADFSGGACAYRRSRFLETGGYVPLPAAYGMEEVDVALRLHALGGRVLQSRRLRVFHNTDLARHADPAVTAASIANIALLAYLRYPVRLWGIGVAQCANRVWWLLRHGRRRGVLRGLASVPATIVRHRRERRPLPGRAVRSYLALRRQAQRA